jgi:uncharacterized membrane protein YccC
MKLSQDAKESIKTALAMTIAYGVALQMGWDRPYRAGFAVAFVSLATVGQSLNKATLRMVGTVVGAIMALTLIGLFAQQRWLFMLFLSLWLGVCTYMNTGSRHLSLPKTQSRAQFLLWAECRLNERKGTGSAWV